MNWTCKQCGVSLEQQFEVCWKCGTAREGVLDESFTDADSYTWPMLVALDSNRSLMGSLSVKSMVTFFTGTIGYAALTVAVLLRFDVLRRELTGRCGCRITWTHGTNFLLVIAFVSFVFGVLIHEYSRAASSRFIAIAIFAVVIDFFMTHWFASL